MFQHIVSFVFTYLMIFWLLIFIALPIGVKTETNPIKGNDHGAPVKHNVKKKFKWTAIVTLVLVSVYFWLKMHGYIDFYSFLERDNA